MPHCSISSAKMLQHQVILTKCFLSEQMSEACMWSWVIHESLPLCEIGGPDFNKNACFQRKTTVRHTEWEGVGDILGNRRRVHFNYSQFPEPHFLKASLRMPTLFPTLPETDAYSRCWRSSRCCLWLPNSPQTCRSKEAFHNYRIFDSILSI